MSGADTEGSECYRHLGGVPFASRVSLHVRRKMFRIFMARFDPGSTARILDVGVTCDTQHRDSNYFEKLYPYPAQITCVGTEDGSHLMREYPGVRYQRIRADERLPFTDGEFDIVFSNAVIEHTGSRAAQAAFVREICRGEGVLYHNAQPSVPGGTSYRPAIRTLSSHCGIPQTARRYTVRLLGRPVESEYSDAARVFAAVSGRRDA
jgi:hypothetical protein